MLKMDTRLKAIWFKDSSLAVYPFFTCKRQHGFIQGAQGSRLHLAQGTLNAPIFPSMLN